MNGLFFIRRRCNLSQGQLAKKLGVTRQAINLWESRREPLPEVRKEQLSRFFGLESELFDEITQAQEDALSIVPVLCTGTMTDTITSCFGRIR